MKAERIDRYKEDHSSYVDIKSLIRTIFYRLDELVEYIQENHEDILDNYIQNLITKFEGVIQDFGSDINYFTDYEKSIELDVLHKYSDLLDKYRRVIEISLQLTKYNVKINKDKLKIAAFDRFRGRKIPIYLNLITLAETIPREDAISLYKEFIKKQSTPSKSRKPSMNDVDDMLNLYKKSFPNTHVYSLNKIEEGKAVCKIDRCMIYEALESFDENLDLEIAYLTSCLNDYGHARMVNHNFLLTREKTIMEHDEYCDFCWHDKSIQKEITHPSQEFWEELN